MLTINLTINLTSTLKARARLAIACLLCVALRIYM